MAQSTVKNLMIEMKSFDNDSMRVRLDNPKDGITRAQIAEVMQPAFTNGWIITDKGSTAGYLGETVLETSTKVKLEGEDFYVTPNSLTLKGMTPQTLTVTGAQIQGYNVTNAVQINVSDVIVEIAENRLTATVKLRTNGGQGEGGACSFNVELIIRGEAVSIPCTATA